MSTDWLSVTIADLRQRGEVDLRTGPFGTQLHAREYVSDGVPVVNVRNIGYGDIRTDGLVFVSEETTERLSQHKLEANDIVFGRKGAVERHAFVQRQQRGWLQGSDCLRVRFAAGSVCPRFVSYFLMTPDHQRWMQNQCSHGATMASLNQDIICRIELPLPPLPTQRKIASILSAYDSLIENNLRRIGILEEMAQATYREWFVHSRFPGHKNAKMVDSPLGTIPEGWTAGSLSDLADVNPVSLSPRRPPDEIAYIDIASVARGSVGPVRRMPFAEAPGRARRVVRNGDILWSTVRPNLRAYALILHPEANLIASTGFAVISGTRAPFTYLYSALTTDGFVSYLVNHATGSAYPAVSARDIGASPIICPEAGLLAEYDGLTRPILELRHLLAVQTGKLRETRDLLLPKLISGELDVSDLEIAMPEVAA